MRIVKNRVGESYGHWKVIQQDIEKTKISNKIYWICECDCGCGTKKSIRGDALIQTTVGGCDNMTMTNPKECLKCHKLFYPKKQAKTRMYCYDCLPEEHYTGAQLKNRIKKWALEYKGNKCEICGYNKCEEALEFHHLNPNEKDFCISDRDIKLNWLKIKEELDKCQLVCANCHREIHSKEKKGDD